MTYRVLFIEKSGRINWRDVETIDDCVIVAKDEQQEVDVYDKYQGTYRYLMTVEVL